MTLGERRAITGYRQLEEIGRCEGRNSRVFRIFDKRLNGEFVAKEIPRPVCPRSADDLYREATLMAAASHPNVVSIRSVCETKTLICLVMPHFANGSLARRI